MQAGYKIVFSKHRPSGPMLSISRNVRLCVRVCVCLFTFEVPFNGLFVPTSQSRMSNIFRDLESLGKSNGKKWSQIWTFLFENFLKSPRQRKVFFFTFFGLLRFSVFFNGLCAPPSQSRISNIFRDLEFSGKSFFLSLFSLLKYRLTVFLPPLPKVRCPIFLKIRNPWGKVMERSGLRYEHFCLKLSKIAAQKKVFIFSHFFLFWGTL